MILSYLVSPAALSRRSIRGLEGALPTLAASPGGTRRRKAGAATPATAAATKATPAAATPSLKAPVQAAPTLATPSPRRRSAIKAAFKAAPRSALWALILFHIWFVCSTSIIVACFSFIDPAATVLAVSRRHVDGWAVSKSYPVKLKAVPLTARRMLVSVEDYKFWNHHGLDFEAFERAVEINKRIGRRMYGGSTLTMQAARTLFLVPVKSYVRKYLEVIIALEMEAILTKDRILELYFSWAEWGKGVFGIEAASRRYYGLSVSKIDAERIARLVAVLSSPIKYGPQTLARSKLLQSRYDFLEERYLR